MCLSTVPCICIELWKERSVRSYPSKIDKSDQLKARNSLFLGKKPARFELKTFRIHVYSATATPACSVWNETYSEVEFPNMLMHRIETLLPSQHPISSNGNVLCVRDTLGGHSIKLVACSNGGTVYWYCRVGWPICSYLNATCPDQSLTADMMAATKQGSR
jgi:hypothetical protein